MLNTNKTDHRSKWVSDCWLEPTQQFFSAISLREQVNIQWDDDEVRFVLDRRAELDFYSASSLTQQSAPLGHVILSQPVFALSP
jgi:hypothetical protein